MSMLMSVLQATHPNLSLRARAVIDAVFLSGGSIGTAHEVASRLGLRNRFALARLLKAEGLPPLHDLAAWASVVAWVQDAERTGQSLCQLAFRAHKDPAVCYRTVKRITGLQWQELKIEGITEVLQRFLAGCHAQTAILRHHAPPGTSITDTVSGLEHERDRGHAGTTYGALDRAKLELPQRRRGRAVF
jgi:hypothetical protein